MLSSLKTKIATSAFNKAAHELDGFAVECLMCRDTGKVVCLTPKQVEEFIPLGAELFSGTNYVAYQPSIHGLYGMAVFGFTENLVRCPTCVANELVTRTEMQMCGVARG